MDERGVLSENEIFFNYSTHSGTICLQGPVVVAKNPCYHPGGCSFIHSFIAICSRKTKLPTFFFGLLSSALTNEVNYFVVDVVVVVVTDIRVLQAVYKKELDHLQDCVVFSQKGERPVPNQIAGL